MATSCIPGRDRGKLLSCGRCVRQGAIHEGTRKMRSTVRNRTAVRAIALAVALTSAGAVSALPSGMALAGNSAASHVLSDRSDRPLVPARCFARVHVKHVVFGPKSFFEPPTTQGPTSFKENAGPTIVTYPLYRGRSHGHRVFYVITDASNLSAARALRVNYAPKLAKAAGTAAVQRSGSHISGGNNIRFPASVNFRPRHILVPSATGFPPTRAQPGAVGRPGYSPLVRVVFRGKTVVLDAPQIANASGRADKIVSISPNHRKVRYRETDGCYDNESVHYVSFDASLSLAAAIEDVTYAPALNSVPSAGCADPAVAVQPCARESLIAFTNGQTGKHNRQRQGLNAAILDRLSPLNILKEIPEPAARFDYSPMWDIHLETWTAAAAMGGLVVRQTSFPDALKQVTNGLATGFPAGSQFGPSGFVVNCPVVSLDVNIEH